ncbi:Transmembrane protein 45A [Microtus ochrogaster]|uniref:Transmembrane protein 45A n=1 Tax=Microtus ochrogaster TaxID=79684 RepID=A0A8J6L100_MICOH|nr:Transmembrane protein 45A [Microtus ochrogaster]
MVLVGAISLQIYAPVSESQLMQVLRLHHTVMYIFYGLLGVTRILGSTTNCLPVFLTKLALSNAFLVQAFIMYNHTHGRVVVDIFLHKILALATVLTGVVSFMEVLTKNNITLELLRSSLILLQGTWLWHFPAFSSITSADCHLRRHSHEDQGSRRHLPMQYHRKFSVDGSLKEPMGSQRGAHSRMQEFSESLEQHLCLRTKHAPSSGPKGRKERDERHCLGTAVSSHKTLEDRRNSAKEACGDAAMAPLVEKGLE